MITTLPPPIRLATHLTVLSFISFGGFPTVLPDVHNLAVPDGWLDYRNARTSSPSPR